jgi:hypothetical protein
VRNYYLELGKKNRKFDTRLPKKQMLPMLLDLHVEEVKIQQNSKEHLHQLSIQLVSEYIHDVIIPTMVQDRYALTPKQERY